MPYEYSSSKIRSRTGLEGEDLIGHRFRNGSLQVVGHADFERWAAIRDGSLVLCREPRPASGGILARGGLAALRNVIRKFLDFYGLTSLCKSDSEPGPVVEIPIGALLRVFEVPFDWQRQYHFAGTEDVLFTDSSQTEGIHDRVLCFGNGAIISWQLLPEGQRVRILRRSWEDSLVPEPDPMYTNA